MLESLRRWMSVAGLNDLNESAADDDDDGAWASLPWPLLLLAPLDTDDDDDENDDPAAAAAGWWLVGGGGAKDCSRQAISRMAQGRAGAWRLSVEAECLV